MAYVVGTERYGMAADLQIKSTWMRICKLGFEVDDLDGELGLTLFHELMHMTSSVSDHSYTKRGMLALAKRDPTLARLNAQTYTYYIAQTGLPRDEYLKLTGRSYAEGDPAFRGFTEGDAKCEDTKSNCPALVGGKCCFNREVD